VWFNKTIYLLTVFENADEHKLVKNNSNIIWILWLMFVISLFLNFTIYSRFEWRVRESKSLKECIQINLSALLPRLFKCNTRLIKLKNSCYSNVNELNKIKEKRYVIFKEGNSWRLANDTFQEGTGFLFTMWHLSFFWLFWISEVPCG